MTEANSYLVPYQLERIPPGCDPYPADVEWAEPDLDEAYRFDHDTTLAILAGFAYNRRVMIQGYHGTGKSTHIEQVAARLNWPCIRVNLDSHISRIDLIGKDAIVLRDVCAGGAAARACDAERLAGAGRQGLIGLRRDDEIGPHQVVDAPTVGHVTLAVFHLGPPDLGGVEGPARHTDDVVYTGFSLESSDQRLAQGPGRSRNRDRETGLTHHVLLSHGPSPR